MEFLGAFSVDRETPIPYYYQIAEWLRGLIDSGQLKPGDALPPEVTLAEHLGVSRLTVRRALTELVNSSLLVRRRAKGTAVADAGPAIPIVVESLLSHTQQAAALGKSLRTRILSQEVVPVSSRLARRLRLAAGAKAVRIYRLRVLDGVPESLENCYFPYERFPELATLDLTDRSIYAILDRQYGALPQDALDSYVVQASNSTEAGLLDLKKGAPVVRFERQALDSQGRPVEFTQATFRADLFHLAIHRRRVTDNTP